MMAAIPLLEMVASSMDMVSRLGRSVLMLRTHFLLQAIFHRASPTLPGGARIHLP